MREGGISPALLEAWLTGRSLARGLPLPVASHGGFRVDTDSAAELRRWVFPNADARIGALAGKIDSPREPVKACIPARDLAKLLPAGWDVQDTGHFMHCRCTPAVPDLPDGFVARTAQGSLSGRIDIVTTNGVLAARGYWGWGAGGFVYDRIVVEAAFRRRGLGRALMGLIGRNRRGDHLPQLLVATEEGRLLYLSLGWEVISPYATAWRR
ncbi:GNAT family N-acetyltransferase [Citromicrobium bathyomarinum]|uniref:GNAT family N-acetyltransferase n=1 Tax=Citromicrobium bathyomarinum TaxID=72174 RepID=UPI003159FFC5